MSLLEWGSLDKLLTTLVVALLFNRMAPSCFHLLVGAFPLSAESHPRSTRYLFHQASGAFLQLCPCVLNRSGPLQEILTGQSTAGWLQSGDLKICRKDKRKENVRMKNGLSKTNPKGLHLSISRTFTRLYECFYPLERWTRQYYGVGRGWGQISWLVHF